MRKQAPWHKQMMRRTFFMGGLQATALMVLTGRLYQLQIVRSDDYKTQAEGNRIKVQLLVPARGALQDRYGAVMAGNAVNYRALLERDKPAQAQETLGKLQTHLSLSDELVQKLKDALQKRRDHAPLLVKEFLSWDEVATIEFHLPELPGVAIEQGTVREYPLGEKGAHIIGYVGRVSEEESQKNPLFRLPDYKIGKTGCEKIFESEVRGIPGTRQFEVNAKGLIVRELERADSKPGEDMKLTLDAQLQAYCHERLGDESGAVIVMDADTGAVRAMASAPSYDPNAFSAGISQKMWNALNANEKNPLLNKAVAGQYPPGSTFKMLVGLAGLDAGVITAEDKVYCPGHYYLGNHRYNCWKAGGHGAMNLPDAIAQSCDTYFYEVANRTGIEKLAAMARRFGLGSATGLDFPNEKPGLIPDPQWKKQERKQNWNPGDTVNAGIGQGFVLATPLQLAVMIARLVNGGKRVDPHLYMQAGSPTKEHFLNIEEEHLNVVLRGMINVMNSPSGTAYWHRSLQQSYLVGGKTGTSQVRRITQRGMDQRQLPWKYRHHALFVGFAPIDMPKYVASVLVEHGGSGSSAAAPVARDVLVKAMQLEEEHNADGE